MSSSTTTNLFGGSSNMSVLVQQNQSLWIPNSSPSFHGAKSMVSFENDEATAKEVSFIRGREENDNDNEFVENDNEELGQPAGKKRRLGASQVEFLEKSFESENKLEPERKARLARELGLEPRQVAIWFQNRRARFKTKQLERDFDALRATYDNLKSEYDTLLSQNDALKLQVNSLKEKLGGKEKSGKQECLELGNANVKTASEDHVSNVPISGCKQEDASSAKSDVFDSSDDSPHCAENNYPSALEPADSSHVFELTEQSDFSQDDDDDDLIMRKSAFIAPPFFLPKLESCYYDEPPASSCNLEFAVEDQPFNFWPY